MKYFLGCWDRWAYFSHLTLRKIHIKEKAPPREKMKLFLKKLPIIPEKTDIFLLHVPFFSKNSHLIFNYITAVKEMKRLLMYFRWNPFYVALFLDANLFPKRWNLKKYDCCKREKMLNENQTTCSKFCQNILVTIYLTKKIKNTSDN